MKKFASIIFGLIFILILYSQAAAEEFDKKFVISKDIKNCLFQIYWDNKSALADVTLTAPDGKAYDKNSTNYHSTEGLVWIAIDTASAGEWSVKINGSNLGKINLEAGAMPDYIKITAFDVKQASNNEFDISWNVSNPSGSISFNVYADKNKSGNGGQLVAQFSGEATGSTRIGIGNIDTGEYYIYLQVMDSMQVPDTKYSSAYYKIVNPNSPAKLGNITCGVLNNEVYAKWDDLQEGAEYKFMLFNKGEAAPFFETTTTDSWYTYPMSSDTKNIELAVAEIRNGVIGDYERQNLNTEIKLDYKIQFPDKQNINYKTIKISTSFKKPLLMSIFVNDAILIDKTDKAGDYSLDMRDGENKVSVAIQDDRGNIKTEEKIFYVDTYPPQLQLTTDLDGKRVKTSAVFISGKTEPAATVNIGGNNVKTDKAGSFVQKVILHPGTNKIVVVSRDMAGNESEIVSMVTYDIFGSLTFYIIAGSAVFLGLAVYYLVILIKIKKRKRSSNDLQAGNDSGKGGESNEKNG